MSVRTSIPHSFKNEFYKLSCKSLKGKTLHAWARFESSKIQNRKTGWLGMLKSDFTEAAEIPYLLEIQRLVDGTLSKKTFIAEFNEFGFLSEGMTVETDFPQVLNPRKYNITSFHSTFPYDPDDPESQLSFSESFQKNVSQIIKDLTDPKAIKLSSRDKEYVYFPHWGSPI